MDYLAIFHVCFFKCSLNITAKALILDEAVYITFIEFKYRALAILMNELLKEEKTLHSFIFILPNFTLGPKFAPFLFTPEDIDYISEIIARF